MLAISAFAAALVVFSFAVDLFLRSGAAWWSFPCCRFVSAFGGCLVVFSFAVDLFLRSRLFGGGPALSHIFLFLLTESHAAKLQI